MFYENISSTVKGKHISFKEQWNFLPIKWKLVKTSQNKSTLDKDDTVAGFSDVELRPLKIESFV